MAANEDLSRNVPSLEPSEHQQQLRAQLLAEHRPQAASRALPRWLRTAAMVCIGATLVGAGVAAKEVYDNATGRSFITSQRTAHLDSKGNVVEKPKPGEEGTSITLSSSSGGTSKEEAQKQQAAIADAISAGRYKKLREEMTTQSGMMYYYSLELAGGARTAINTTVPLEQVKTWDELQQKQMQLAVQRSRELMQAVSAGKAKIVSDDTFIQHVCRERDSGKDVQVMRLKLPDGKLLAITQTLPLGPDSSSQSAPWQEHLDALSSGAREYKSTTAATQFEYEITLPDGSKRLQKSGFVRVGQSGKEPG